MKVVRTSKFRIGIAREWNSFTGRLKPVGFHVCYWIFKPEES